MRWPYLHWTLVDQHPIELDQGIVGAPWLAENDCRNAAADAVGAISEHSFLDWTHGFGEVFL